MTHFHPYEPTLASAAVDGALIGLTSFAVLLGLAWLGRWVVRFFKLNDEEDEE